MYTDDNNNLNNGYNNDYNNNYNNDYNNPKKKGFIKYIIIILIGLAIFLALYYFLLRNDNIDDFDDDIVINDIKVVLNKNSDTVYVGSSVYLEAFIINSKGSVTWSSDNTSVCSVSDGKVSTLKEGSCTVTAKFNDFSDSCYIVVNKLISGNDKPSINVPSDGKKHIKSITVNSKTEVNLKSGDSFVIDYFADPSVNDDSVLFSVNDENICKVNSKGVVYGLSKGDCFVKISSSYGSARGDVLLHIDGTKSNLSGYKKVSSAEMISPKIVNLSVNSSSQIIIKTSPNDASNSKVHYWTNGLDDSCIVSDSGVITAVKKSNEYCLVMASIDMNRYLFTTQVNIK